MFVSSRIGLDLDGERELVASTIDDLSSDFARAWLWERDGLGGQSVRETCLHFARGSDMLILLVGQDVSPIVEAEFDTAFDAGVTCIVLRKPAFATLRCRRFLTRLARRGVMPLNFQNHSELRTHLIKRINGHLLTAFRSRRRDR